MMLGLGADSSASDHAHTATAAAAKSSPRALHDSWRRHRMCEDRDAFPRGVGEEQRALDYDRAERRHHAPLFIGASFVERRS